jgi:hypothetical protein
MDQATRNKIKDFWINRAIQEKFLWRDLLDLNFSLIKKHITPGCSVLDVGAGDGSWLKESGVMIIKHQCGKLEDKIVDKYSEELDSHYIAHYRSVDHEIKLMTPAMPDGLLLTGDPYPEEYNKWPDTAFKVFEMHNEGKADHMPRI